MSDSDVILFRKTFLRHREIGFDPIAGILTSQSLDSEPNTGRMSGWQHFVRKLYFQQYGPLVEDLTDLINGE